MLSVKKYSLGGEILIMLGECYTERTSKSVCSLEWDSYVTLGIRSDTVYFVLRRDKVYSSVHLSACFYISFL